MIVELGYRQLSASATYTGGINCGVNTSYADMPENEDTTGTYNGWIEFSADIAFLGYFPETAVEIETEAYLKLLPISSIVAPSSIVPTIESEVILELIPREWSESVTEEEADETVELESGAILYYGSDPLWNIAVEEPLDFEAILYLDPVSGLTIVAITILSHISKANLRYTAVSGLEVQSAVVTEPEEYSITSDATLIYGGLTETLLSIITTLETTSILSGALFYYYGDSDLGPPTKTAYQLRSQAALTYYGQDSLAILSLSIESIESNPILIYDLPEGESGIDETEVYETWVLTSQEWNPSVYSNYDFNSFIEIDGRFYGAKDDGIYLLEGSDDAGTRFRTGLKLHTNLGLHGTKTIRMVHAERCGVGARLRVTETEDETHRDFPLRRRIFQGNRELIGRDFVLEFQDFDELGHLRFVPQVMVRDGRSG